MTARGPLTAALVAAALGRGPVSVGGLVVETGRRSAQLQRELDALVRTGRAHVVATYVGNVYVATAEQAAMLRDADEKRRAHMRAVALEPRQASNLERFAETYGAAGGAVSPGLAADIATGRTALGQA